MSISQKPLWLILKGWKVSTRTGCQISSPGDVIRAGGLEGLWRILNIKNAFISLFYFISKTWLSTLFYTDFFVKPNKINIYTYVKQKIFITFLYSRNTNNYKINNWVWINIGLKRIRTLFKNWTSFSVLWLQKEFYIFRPLLNLNKRPSIFHKWQN